MRSLSDPCELVASNTPVVRTRGFRDAPRFAALVGVVPRASLCSSELAPQSQEPVQDHLQDRRTAEDRPMFCSVYGPAPRGSRRPVSETRRLMAEVTTLAPALLAAV